MKFDRKYVKYIAAGVLAVGIIAVPVSAAMVATDQPLSGASVVVDEYCNQVANGAVTSAAVSVTRNRWWKSHSRQQHRKKHKKVMNM